MKNVLTLPLIFLFASFIFSCKEKEKTKVNQQPQTQITNEEKAQQILDRAKFLLAQLDDSKDIYGLKRIFSEAKVTQSRLINGQWEFLMPEGGFYFLISVSSQKDFDQGFGGLPVVMMTTNGTFNGQDFAFIIVNPRWLYLAEKDADFDYLASAMLHEAVHCWQFFAVESGLRSQVTSIEREREAYEFQFLFLPNILERNNLQNITVPKGFEIKNHKDMLVAASKTDVENGNKLGMLSNLVFQQAYFEKCLPLLTLKE